MRESWGEAVIEGVLREMQSQVKQDVLFNILSPYMVNRAASLGGVFMLFVCLSLLSVLLSLNVIVVVLCVKLHKAVVKNKFPLSDVM